MYGPGADNGFAIRIRQCISTWIDDHTVLFWSSFLSSPDSRVDNHENLFYVILISFLRPYVSRYIDVYTLWLWQWVCHGPKHQQQCAACDCVWVSCINRTCFVHHTHQAYMNRPCAHWKLMHFFILLHVFNLSRSIASQRTSHFAKHDSKRIFSIIHISFSFSSFTDWQEILLLMVVFKIATIYSTSAVVYWCMRMSLRRHHFYLLFQPFLLIATILLKNGFSVEFLWLGRRRMYERCLPNRNDCAIDHDSFDANGSKIISSRQFQFDLSFCKRANAKQERNENSRTWFHFLHIKLINFARHWN